MCSFAGCNTYPARFGKVFLACLCFISGSAAAVSSSEEAPKPLSADDGQSLIDIAVAAMENNYARARTIRARVRVVSETLGLDQVERREVKSPDGAVGYEVRYPRREYTLDCLLQDHDYLVTEKYDGKDVLRSAADGRWTYYPTDGSTAWIYGRTEGPTRRPCDPRTVGLPTQLVPVESFLRSNRMVSVARARTGDAELAHVLVADKKGQFFDFVLDPGQQFLPIRITHRRQDGLVAVDTTIEYQRVAGDAFFLDKAVQEFRNFEPDAEVGTIASRMTWKVVECTVLAEPVDKSAFVIDIPKSVAISDSATGTYTPAKKTPEIPQRPGWSRFFIWVNVVVAAGLVVVAILRVRRRRTRTLSE